MDIEEKSLEEKIKQQIKDLQRCSRVKPFYSNKEVVNMFKLIIGEDTWE